MWLKDNQAYVKVQDGFRGEEKGGKEMSKKGGFIVCTEKNKSRQNVNGDNRVRRRVMECVQKKLGEKSITDLEGVAERKNRKIKEKLQEGVIQREDGKRKEVHSDYRKEKVKKGMF